MLLRSINRPTHLSVVNTLPDPERPEPTTAPRYKVTLRDSQGQVWSFTESYRTDAEYEALLMEGCGYTLISISEVCHSTARPA